MRKLLPAPFLGALLAVAAGCGDDGAPKNFSAKFRALNGSGVRATAQLEHKTEERDELTVVLRARGLEPRQPHPLMIHGFPGEDRRASCPGRGADADGDGVVDANEGERTYGPALLPLTPTPSSDSRGRISFRLTFNARRDRTEPFDNRVLVFHGGTPRGGGAYEPELPVACAPILPPRGKLDEQGRLQLEVRTLRDEVRRLKAERDQLRRQAR